MPDPITPITSPAHGSSQPSSKSRPVEEPREADLVGEVLDARRLPLALRRVLRELGEVRRRRIVRQPELAEQRAVHDEIGIAADRRGEVRVRRAREAGVPEVPRVVARLLERPQDERRERLAAAARLFGVLADAPRDLARRARRLLRCQCAPAPAASARRGRSASRAGARPPAGRAARARGTAPRAGGRRGTRRRARSRAPSAPRRACARAARPRATRRRRRPRRRTRTRPPASAPAARRARTASPAAPSRARRSARARRGSPATPRAAAPARR